jgi:hypothetical protein
MPSI